MAGQDYLCEIIYEIIHRSFFLSPRGFLEGCIQQRKEKRHDGHDLIMNDIKLFTLIQ